MGTIEFKETRIENQAIHNAAAASESGGKDDVMGARIPASLKAQYQDQAQQDGFTDSEYVRQALKLRSIFTYPEIEKLIFYFGAVKHELKSLEPPLTLRW